ncbi:MAG: hypothetical protein P4M15_11535 [Alphaproteobacteria bacterium]|nr:hypothetical protein [Alphaproteobacteria bacterium]
MTPLTLQYHTGSEILTLRRESRPHAPRYNAEHAGSPAVPAVDVRIPFSAEQFKVLQHAIAVRGNDLHALASGAGEPCDEHGRTWGSTLDLSATGIEKLKANVAADEIWFAGRRENPAARAATRAAARSLASINP